MGREGPSRAPAGGGLGLSFGYAQAGVGSAYQEVWGEQVPVEGNGSGASHGALTIVVAQNSSKRFKNGTLFLFPKRRLKRFKTVKYET